MLALLINSTSNCLKCLLSLDKIRAALLLPVRIVGVDTVTLEVGNIFVMYYFS